MVEKFPGPLPPTNKIFPLNLYKDEIIYVRGFKTKVIPQSVIELAKTK